MRRLLSYGLLFLLLAACTREESPVDGTWDGPVMELFLEVVDPETKAEEDGEGEGNGQTYEVPGENMYHENDIKWVDFYFYPGGNTSSQATYHRRETLSRLTRDHAAFRFELTTGIVNDRIFPVAQEVDGVKMQTVVLALVNVDKNLLDGQDNTSMEALKSLLVNTDFAEKKTAENYRQQYFMMSGETVITLKGRTRKEIIEDTGSTIQLSRYACKITVGIQTKPFMEIELKNEDGTPKVDSDNIPLKEVWTPSLEEMRIYLENGMKTVSLGGEPVDARSGAPDGYEVLSYKDNPLFFFRDEGVPGAPEYYQIFDTSNGYYNTYPMYTYPQRWSNGKEGEPYIKLVLPWERAAYSKGGETYIKQTKKEFYYKILIPNDARSFVRNNWYHYNIDVGMLGADTDDTEVELTPTCYVYYWQDKNVVIKHADIGNARYLSVNKTLMTLNNETSYRINLTSSHPVGFRVNSVTRPYYGDVEEKKDEDGESVTYSPESVNGGIMKKGDDGKFYLDFLDKAKSDNWFSLEGGSIVMNHSLDNNFNSSTFDYAPYTMSVTLWHADQVKDPTNIEEELEKTEYKATVTIIQRPAIYIEEELNSDPQLKKPDGKPLEGDDTQNNASGNVWRNYANNGYVFYDGSRLMRHRTNKNDDGEYGIMARKLNSDWKNSRNDAGEGVAEKLEWLQWRTVNFTGGNRNLYTIHVTVLEKGSKFVIGDPRTRTPDNLNNGLETCSTQNSQYKYFYWYNNEDPWYYWDWNNYSRTDYVRNTENSEFTIEFRPAHVINDKNGVPRKLKYYYPAENSAATQQMLAPALRVSSRFGGVEFYDGITWRSAQFKCATYQEDGYPAGRWRLPTEAEVDFIGTLTQKGDFVPLFGRKGGNSSFYWSANGAVKPNDKFDADPNQPYALARCVYDAWYWDPLDDRLPEGERDNFYFGDLER